MKYRTFPKTALTVSEVAFGVWTLGTGWWGKIGDSDAIRLVNQALDLGVNYIETAAVTATTPEP